MEKPKRVFRTLSELPPDATYVRLVHVLPGVKVTDQQMAHFLGSSSIPHFVKYTEEVTTPEIRGIVISPTKEIPSLRKNVHLHSQASIRAMSPQVQIPILRTRKCRKQRQFCPSPLRIQSIHSTKEYHNLMTSHLHIPIRCLTQPFSRPGRSYSPIPALYRPLSHCKKSTLS